MSKNDASRIIIDDLRVMLQLVALFTIIIYNGTACFKIVNNCLNTNIYSYIETSGGKSFNLYVNVHVFNISVN